MRIGAGSANPDPGATASANAADGEEKKIKDAKADHRRVRLGMSELHSSIKNGCLM